MSKQIRRFFTSIGPVHPRWFRSDITPEGVIGLGGNVTEWTGTREPDEDTGKLRAVLKGGHFKERGDISSLTFTESRADMGVRDITVGFRLAADK